MRLSKLDIGTEAYIVKIEGDDSFRRRINEMGFVPGTKIKVVKKAPLNDPIEYELMGYRISLRSAEASMIKVSRQADCGHNCNSFRGTIPAEEYHDKAVKSDKKIRIALVGNPNCGKTTLFNFATGSHERVGNYSGVTVDIKEASWKFKDYKIELIDLPGTYSLSTYSPEEIYVRDYLIQNTPDIVINMIDASNLERNLFLTTQLIDMNLKVVVALNMYDELKLKGDTFDYDMLGRMLGIPFTPTTAKKGEGIEDLFDQVIEVYRGESSYYRHCHINYGDDINSALRSIKAEIKSCHMLSSKHHNQYIAVKLLEGDSHTIAMVEGCRHSEAILSVAKKEVSRLQHNYKESSDATIASARYSFIRGALKETFSSKDMMSSPGYRADKVLTSRWLGFPLFLVILGLIFEVTFALGDYPMGWIESGIEWLGETISSLIPSGVLHDLVVDGIIGGVGSVMVFLPNIALLFAFISLLEDSGYMARVAFIMDKIMHKIGLHGKSSIPMLMGFGCNVPAILATKVLENRKDRLVTMLIIPFMSCNARLPIYLMLTAIFFPVNQGTVLLSIYAIGVLIAILSAWLLNRFMSSSEAPFVMELPPYRMPAMRNTLKHTWNKSKQYLSKMGGIILVASILIWALGYFPRDINVENSQNIDEPSIENSYIAQLGHFIEPAISPLGYDWRAGVGLISGIAAKETVVSTMSILYGGSEDDESVEIKGMTPLTAYSFMIFVLLYFPCMAVIAAIKREAGSRWALFSILYTTTLSWIIAFVINSIGGLF